ncbi:MAG TPA: hypothetical protein DIT04_01030 [Dysgonomonas sp.]|nr:hypothetical protein [Dysgonomonas sp.]
MVFAVTALGSKLNAQDVYFTNQKVNTDGNRVDAQVYASQPVTVMFELQTTQASNTSGHGSYMIIDYSNYLSVYMPYGSGNPSKTTYYLTAQLPAGYSNVVVTASKVTSVLLIKEVNGRSFSRPPIVLTNR